ncbi:MULTISPECIES: DUF2470 domain-containing protein [Thalassospira]|uniref:DUF2470 domain-containing protein n=1 Tax=Thalassospira TaxID=168934 RepID=UPI0008DD3CBF|nr:MULTISPECIES: DUF2470 domain-containing protein [Thalassospira]MAB34663.1 DUF2470 domain-containing protein [Thalassospira sp.]MBA07302.1 DUF2470 domain-containing protein [Thalassospira sp.]MDM7977538.1 DUF2470 domain-containing protein [Thalassospira xiamenensis]OHZ04695.1 hypothetical protein BC440_06465 [Thalassospira sp. MIT1004]HBS22147.1 DUF2470 domain-containing protein [Thalassospira sp.]|tara:strand:- start:923 stop:1342 length:420 start_codon:yes stop_codon:yes gene_type:complete
MSSLAQQNGNAAAELRRMTRRALHAVMATTACDHKQVGDGWPVTSIVVPAAHIDGHDEVIFHMNSDHADAIADIVGYFTDQDKNDGWKMVAIDCDGMDLECNSADSRPLRVNFTETIRSPGEARDILVEMCKKSRGQVS